MLEEIGMRMGAVDEREGLSGLNRGKSFVKTGTSFFEKL